MTRVTYLFCTKPSTLRDLHFFFFISTFSCLNTIINSTGGPGSSPKKQRFPMERAVRDHIGVWTQEVSVPHVCDRRADTHHDVRLPVVFGLGYVYTPKNQLGYSDTPTFLTISQCLCYFNSKEWWISQVLTYQLILKYYSTIIKFLIKSGYLPLFISKIVNNNGPQT